MNNSICTLFDNILIDIHKFKSLRFFENKPDALQGYYIEDSKQLALF